MTEFLLGLVGGMAGGGVALFVWAVMGAAGGGGPAPTPKPPPPRDPPPRRPHETMWGRARESYRAGRRYWYGE